MNHYNTTENSNSNNSPFKLTLDETLIWDGRPCLHLLMRTIWIKHVFGASVILILAYLWKVGMPISIQKYIPEALLSFINSAHWVSYILFVFGFALVILPLIRRWQYNNTRYIITNKRIALISESKEVREWEKDDFLHQAQLTQHSKDWVSLTLWNKVDDSTSQEHHEKIGLLYIPSDIYSKIK